MSEFDRLQADQQEQYADTVARMHALEQGGQAALSDLVDIAKDLVRRVGELEELSTPDSRPREAVYEPSQRPLPPQASNRDLWLAALVGAVVSLVANLHHLF